MDNHTMTNTYNARQAYPVARLFGFDIANVTLDEAVDLLMTRLHWRRETRVSFLNADCVNIAHRNADYAAAARDSDLIFADGSGMKIAAWMRGRQLRDNVNGTDLFPALMRRAGHENPRVYLLGGKPGVADRVAEHIVEAYPGVEVVGARHGYFRADKTPEVVADIATARPEILLVALGAPRQELWLRKWQSQTGAIIGVGVGGLFDFYSGSIPRAPRWMRRLGQEWIWRLAQEPRRLWKRYIIGNPLFLARAVRHAWPGARQPFLPA